MVNDYFDEKIRRKFETILLDLAVDIRVSHERHEWLNEAESALALLLLFGQFPRFIYRHTKAAYAFDDIALTVCQAAISRGFDLKMPFSRRPYFYAPFLRVEDINIVREGVRLIDMRLQDGNIVAHAVRRLSQIERFGRFPRRNQILGRVSTSQEEQFLAV